MNILYLHGLDSGPNEKKYYLMRDAGHSVEMPRLNYRAFENSIYLFEDLVAEVEMKGINFIVGSSFGGYMGFHLSEYCNLPALLFNPALGYQSSAVPVKEEFSDSKKTIILGKLDDVVDPQDTRDFFASGKYTNTKIVELEIGHLVKPDVFEDCLKYIGV